MQYKPPPISKVKGCWKNPTKYSKIIYKNHQFLKTTCSNELAADCSHGRVAMKLVMRYYVTWHDGFAWHRGLTGVVYIMLLMTLDQARWEGSMVSQVPSFDPF